METRKLLLAACLAAGTFSLHAQAPAESEDVMLQGFYWDSQKETGWTQLAAKAADIGRTFTCIWLPPSASAEGGGAVGGTNVGYHPRIWNDQTSCWGTAADLKTLISALHAEGVKVIADIVINHRAGYTDWGNFAPDDFGAYGSYQLTAAHICKGDEMNTDPAAGSWRGQATGAADTGENWNGARDLDHTSDYVQADCKAYLAWLKGEFGYDGWRYDYCKGFGGKYVGIYNEASSPYISVGEYWDGGYDPVAAWIESTGKQSMAFDFPMKFDALNNGLAKGIYSKMSWIEDNTTWRPAGMIHHRNYNRYAVTFVDNHDTYRDGNKYTGNVPQAYAFILSAPGVPCVFWPHWTAYASDIEQQVAARRAAGIHSQSDVEVTARSTYYECRSVGHHGTLVCRIGAGVQSQAAPEGFHVACSGTNWVYYLSDDVSGMQSVTVQPDVQLAGRTLRVSASASLPVRVCTVDGRTVLSASAAPSVPFSCTLSPGIYVVKAGLHSTKLLVE